VIAEAFQANEPFAAAIRQREDISDRAKALMPNSLIEDGVLKVRTGQTSPSELMRVLSS
jgi:type II secretory ATPase GspE/PulE/Tfp pilus assembly ATPase PilB-like protein